MIKKMNKLGSLRMALAASLGIPFVIASSALAQDPVPPVEETAVAPAAATEGATATTDRVVVTGSYIPTAETESALPVTVYTATVLQKQGANTPVEGLRQLPSFVGNAATENDANGGNGSATINLRALGSGNTLVLINGRRAFLGSLINGGANVNAIPLGALARSEVLKDGASAIYGSDAVAGVVNFILLNGPGEAPYEGAEIDFLYGNTTDNDARVLQAYVKGGVATEKVSVAAAAEYYDRDAIFSRDREISASADRRFLGGSNTGSATYPGRTSFRTNPAVGASNRASVLINQANPNPMGPADYRAYGGPNSPDPFNFRTTTPAIPGMEKYQTYVAGRYKIFGEALQVYGDMLHAKTKQDNALAPAPFGFGVVEANSSPYNPFVGTANDDPNVPATYSDNQLRSLAYRAIEGGLRQSFYDSDYFRYALGFNGNFSFTGNNFLSFFGYDTGMVYERGDQIRTDQGDFRFTPLAAETAAGNFNPFRGLNAPVAGTATTFTNGVPTGTQAFDNAAALQRASYTGITSNLQKDFLADAKVFGNLFPNLYQGGVGFNLGYEYRHTRQKQIPDPTQSDGDQLGFNAATPFSFHQTVNSYFGELQVPLVTSTMNIPFVRSLDAAVAYRYEEFDNKDNFGDSSTPGQPKRTSSFNNNGDVRVSLRYAPVQDITLRASFGESFLSPVPFQLFAPIADNFPQLFDPASINPGGTRGQTLQPRDGVVQGGNPSLTPETTESYTAGIVITPRFLPGFTATVDFYQLFTRNVILPSANFAAIALTQNGQFLLANPGAPPEAAPFGVPFNTPPRFEDPTAPTAVYREEGTFLVTRIEGANTQNAGKRLVNGMDITATYQIPTSNWGTFTLSAGYNYFFTWKAEALEGLGTRSYLGDYNNGSLPLAPGGLPYHKGFLRGEHAWRNFNLVATVNYISSFNDDSFFVPASNQVGGTATNPQFDSYRRVSDYITLDMQLTYEFVKPEMEPLAAAGKDFSKDGKSMAPEVAGVETAPFWKRMLWGTTLKVGVNNAFDRNPPTVLGAFNDNYDTSLYSIRNRYWYVGVNKKF